jgi:glycerophosphoryl diester phosphodiesterase
MTAILRGPGSAPLRPVQALALGLHLVLGRFAALFHFAALLVLRILALAAPFGLVAGSIALFTLRDYDINYYLTNMPPSFVAAAALIAALGLALAVILLRRLSGWAIALNCLLFEDAAPRAAFADSTARLEGRRHDVVLRITAWVGVRLLLGGIITGIAGMLLSAVPGLLGHRLGAAAALSLVILGLLVLGGAIVAALCNGALAALLNSIHRAASPDAAKHTVPDRAPAPAKPLPMVVVAVICVTAIGGGVFAAGRLLEQVQGDRPIAIIAHRGAAAARPENTMASVQKALEDRADWVEIDVQETADGTVVVAHDSDFMKLGGNPLKVWDATLPDLAGIDIGSWFDPIYAGERTPTLRDVLLAAKGRGKVMIELKYYGHDVMLEDRVAQIVEETGMTDSVAVMSLKYSGVQAMRALRPDWRYGVLAATAIGDLSGLETDFLAVNTGQVSTHLIRRAHEQGKQVYAWTVNDPVTMSRMVSMGVDGLITDEPARAREVLAARRDLSAPERLVLWLTDRLRIGRFDLVVSETDA